MILCNLCGNVVLYFCTLPSVCLCQVQKDVMGEIMQTRPAPPDGGWPEVDPAFLIYAQIMYLVIAL